MAILVTFNNHNRFSKCLDLKMDHRMDNKEAPAGRETCKIHQISGSFVLQTVFVKPLGTGLNMSQKKCWALRGLCEGDSKCGRDPLIQTGSKPFSIEVSPDPGAVITSVCFCTLCMFLVVLNQLQIIDDMTSMIVEKSKEIMNEKDLQIHQISIASSSRL